MNEIYNRSFYKRLGIWAIVIVIILLVPQLASFPWTAGDYMFAGCVLFGGALVYEWVSSRFRRVEYRIFTALVIISLLILIWAWAVA